MRCLLYGAKLPRKSVVPSTGTCGPPKDCFIDVRVPREELGANHTWSCNAGRGFGLGWKKHQGSWAKGWGEWWAEPSAQHFFFFVLQHDWSRLSKEFRRSMLQTLAAQGLSSGAGLSLIYWLVCVCVCRGRIIATGWVEPAGGQYPAQRETVVYVFLLQPTFIHCSWNKVFSKWKLADGPLAACKTWQLGWGGRWGEETLAFDVFLAVLFEQLNFDNLSSWTTGWCSQQMYGSQQGIFLGWHFPWRKIYGITQSTERR